MEPLPLPRATHKNRVSMRVHRIHNCDANIPALLREPPSRIINSKERLEEGDDHLLCVGRSAECVASRKHLDDTSSLWCVMVLSATLVTKRKLQRDFA